MAAVTVATLTARLEAQTRDFQTQIANAEKRLNQLETASGRAGKAASQMGTVVRAVGGVAVAQFARQTIMAAVAAEEAASAFATSFGPAVGKVSDFVDEFANRAGFANYELEQMLAVTGNVAQGIGATENEAADLSIRMATLAGDVASFSNASGGAEAVLGALQSAINGEREALKTYGLAISEVEVQQLALEMTGKSHVDQLTRLDKALATVEMAYRKADKAVGDLERTQDSTANQLRLANARFKELQVQLGQRLVPVLNDMLPVLNGIIGALGGVIEQLDRMPGAAGGAAVALGALAFGASAPLALAAGLVAMSTAGESVADRLVRLADEAQSAIGPAVRFEERLRGMDAAARRTADGLDRAARSTLDLAEAQLAAADPMFAAIDAAERWSATVADAAEDGVFTEREMLAIAKAVLEANAAFDALDPSQTEAAMQAIATALGITTAAARDLIATWGGFGSLPLPPAVTGGGRVGIYSRHSGGMVPGPSGAAVPILAMAGERVVPAGVSSGGGGGGSVNVYVAGSVVSERDLVDAVRRGLRQDRIRGGSLEL